ncbi:MAG TPA: capsule biosynthesis protein [Nitrospinaceae bacterium]|nr:capsule biosynthesis protein [Nitrospinaceae bacterium]
MKQIKEKATRHLKDKNVGYVKHFFCACSYAFSSLLLFHVLLIHAIFPFLFESTASSMFEKLLKKMK